MELGVGNHGQVIFQTHPVREPPHRSGRADKISELVGAIQRSGVVVDMVMERILSRIILSIHAVTQTTEIS